LITSRGLTIEPAMLPDKPDNKILSKNYGSLGFKQNLTRFF